MAITDINGALDSIGGAFDTAVAAINNAPATAAKLNPVAAVSSSITNYVIIILGLLLVAAGIFSFDKTREIVVNTAKAAGKAGVTAAAAA